MDKYILGFNAIANDGQIGDENKYLAVVKVLNSSFQLVMSNTELATKAHDITEGKTQIIYRSFSSLEGNQWRSVNAKIYAEELMALKDTRLMLYGLNEPNADNSNASEVTQRNDWLAEVVHRVCGAGRKLVIGNFASGSWELLHIQMGLYDTLLRSISQYRDLCYLGVHEYCPVFIPMTFSTIQKKHGLRDRDNVQPKDWLYLDNPDKDYQLPDYRQNLKAYYFHLFRSSWFNIRCMDIGIAPIEMIVTEFGTDRLQDIEGEGDIYEYFKNNYGVPIPYVALHGFLSNYKAWKYYFPQWTTSRALFEQLKWVRLNYDSGWYKGILLFMWGYDHEFRKGGFNLAPETELHNYMIADSQLINLDPISEIPPIIIQNIKIDLLDYLRGDGRVYNISFFFENSGFQVVQTHIDGRRFYHVKGAIGYDSQWEELWYDNDYIWRGTDCSPSLKELYMTSENGGYGSKWIQRHVEVRDKYLAKPTVTFLYQETGDPVLDKAPYEFQHWIQIEKIYSSFTFESGLTLNNVVELRGYLNNNGELGLNFEIYYYAKGYGLVAWKDPMRGDRRSFFSRDYPPGTFLTRKIISWLIQPDLPYLLEYIMIDFPSYDENWVEVTLKSKFNFVNVRSQPTTDESIVITISSVVDGLILLDRSIEKSDGVWIPVRIEDKDGWIRDDVFSYNYPIPPVVEPDPEHYPTDVLKFAPFPYPEVGLTQDDANLLARHYRWQAEGMELFPSGIKNEVYRIEVARWTAVVIENMNETLEKYTGVTIIKEKSNEN